ncbi:hypothetical protein GCM10010206_17710 [Streptomyces cinerochromogenes]|nr:hypothetical protein GCM10010206_17710 [Streptomyces cinerochromogenes]
MVLRLDVEDESQMGLGVRPLAERVLTGREGESYGSIGGGCGVGAFEKVSGLGGTPGVEVDFRSAEQGGGIVPDIYHGSKYGVVGRSCGGLRP